MAKKQRFYFIDTHTSGEKLAIVEKATNAVTKDGYTDQYDTVSEVKPVKIRGVFTDTDLVAGTLTGTYSNIPSRFHEHIVTKVIAMLYKDPRNLHFDTAQFFDQEYNIGVKEAKKFSRSDYKTVGFIKPQDF